MLSRASFIGIVLVTTLSITNSYLNGVNHIGYSLIDDTSFFDNNYLRNLRGSNPLRYFVDRNRGGVTIPSRVLQAEEEYPYDNNNQEDNNIELEPGTGREDGLLPDNGEIIDEDLGQNPRFDYPVDDENNTLQIDLEGPYYNEEQRITTQWIVLTAVFSVFGLIVLLMLVTWLLISRRNESRKAAKVKMQHDSIMEAAMITRMEEEMEMMARQVEIAMQIEAFEMERIEMLDYVLAHVMDLVEKEIDRRENPAPARSAPRRIGANTVTFGTFGFE